MRLVEIIGWHRHPEGKARNVERDDVDFMKLGGQGKSRSDKPAANANFDGTLTHADPSTAV